MWGTNKVLCNKPWSECLIRDNGNVYFCCHSGCLGNLKEQSFTEIWHSDLAKEIRQYMIDGVLHPNCESPSCPIKLKILN